MADLPADHDEDKISVERGNVDLVALALLNDISRKLDTLISLLEKKEEDSG